MSVDFEKVITEKSQQTRNEFRALLDKTNKENSLHQPEAISSSFAAVSVEGKRGRPSSFRNSLSCRKHIRVSKRLLPQNPKP
jgi:hypothetical protein